MLSRGPTFATVTTALAAQFKTKGSQQNGTEDLSISQPEVADDRRENLLWLLRGETRHMKVGPVSLFEQTNSSCPTASGYLFLTNYRVVFIPSTHDCLLPNGQAFAAIPVRSISVSKRFSFGADRHEIVITTRLLRHVKILFERQETECTVLQALIDRLINSDSFSRWFAFDYHSAGQAPDPEPTFNQWRCYDPVEEFARMGIAADSPDWRLVPNEQYALCDTYPSVVCVPHGASDQLLSAVTSFRSRQRIPVLCWRKPNSRVAMFRSSQPLVGIVNWSDDDQFMMQLIKRSNPDSKWVYIFDARPKVNAVGNRVAGAGYERSYENCKVQFQNIDNIHEVQASFDRLFNLINKTSHDASQDLSWLSGLESTYWLSHIHKIIAASIYMVDVMDGRKQSSVLVHCSDGWDRTSQMCSLAQLLLDPHYRTVRGFAMLIEKEWLSFGHRFAERCFGMHREGSLRSNHVSPVFLQFLDCVWQLKLQFPLSFEFNTHFLVTLVDAAYDSKYGTFLFNSERERVEARVHTRTDSVWCELFKRIEAFVDPLYQRNPHTLRPVNSLKKIRFWEEAYLRWDFGLRKKESCDDQLRSLLEQKTELQTKLQQMQVQLQQLRSRPVEGPEPRSPAIERRAKAQAEALSVVDLILERTYDAIAAVWHARHEELGPRKAAKHTSFYLPKWVPDESATHCHHCRSAFTLLRRKHHCRCCGDVFCDACSGQQRPIPRMNFFTPVRICVDCCKILDKEEQSKPLQPKKEFEIAIGAREFSNSVSLRGDAHERSFSLPPQALRRLTLIGSGHGTTAGLHRTIADFAAGVG
eukprot:TRINITY_DN30964_c0_g1_i1.p1 TRINITY_DN30964_c0_g1~~TRINITY_DN30964_c0_g1_i1.p1  ORF type:complete len:811 (-),score=209.76 TRINITY_DN30964_c0_g1_i1:342-2774(-)